MPRVSVILSTHNDGPYIAEAVGSILGQSFQDFEFLVVDDGSTDDTGTVLASFSDPRLMVLTNERNLGLSRSLNRALALARGEYIARMDGNDVSLPHRLASQVAFLDGRPDIGITSVNMIFVDVSGQPLNQGEPVYPLDRGGPGYLRWALLWSNPIAHVGIMMRNSLFRTGGLAYEPRFDGGEDYELWTRACRLTNLLRMPEVHIECRKVPGSVTSDVTRQLKLALVIQDRFWDGFLGAEHRPDALRSAMALLTGYAPAYGELPPDAPDQAAGLVALACARSLEGPVDAAERDQIIEEARRYLRIIAGGVDEALREGWLREYLETLPGADAGRGSEAGHG